MRIISGKNYDEMSHKAACVIASQINVKPDSVLGLATGSTPLGTYARLIDWYKQGDLDFSGVTSINLDEYAGLAPDNDQSYRYFMNKNLFQHININPARTHVPNGLAADDNAECARYDSVISQNGGIDLQLLGLGLNGHIGFNEPDDSFAKGTHKVALTESTIQANKRFFEKEEDVPRFAYTMGIRSIMQARMVVLIASGEAKADIIRDAFSGPVTPRVPASILQLHSNVVLVGDEAALAKLDINAT